MTRIPIPLPVPPVNPLQPPLGALSTTVGNVKVLKDTAKLSAPQALGRGVAEAAASQDAWPPFRIERSVNPVDLRDQYTRAAAPKSVLEVPAETMTIG